MASVFRSTIVGLAVASFAALALVGDGLHGLPGFQHGIVPHQGYCTGHRECPCRVAPPACCAGPGCGAVGKPEAPPEPGCPSQQHTCPVCRLLAQAKAPVAAAGTPPLGETVPDAPALSSSFYVFLPVRAFDARGPPRGV